MVIKIMFLFVLAVFGTGCATTKNSGSDESSATNLPDDVSSRAWSSKIPLYKKLSPIQKSPSPENKVNEVELGASSDFSSNTREKGITEVPLYFGTDREKSSSKDKNKYFGVERGELVYGKLIVTVPFNQNHKCGKIERPIWRKFKLNPEKHFETHDPITFNKENFYEAFKDELSQKPDHTALIFVHGYNVNFEEAALRTAQMSYDLSFQGVSLFFSWPSNGVVSKYTVDRENIIWSTPHIKQFIKDALEITDAERIYLIAHSMGSQGLTSALVELYNENPEYLARIEEVILAAPDIDADIFKRDIAPVFKKVSQSVTIYASSNDKPLKLSKKLNGYPRLGDSGDEIVIFEGMETIDASDLQHDFLGHSYFASKSAVIDDISSLIRDNLRASQRSSLDKTERSKEYYWKMRKQQPNLANACNTK